MIWVSSSTAIIGVTINGSETPTPGGLILQESGVKEHGGKMFPNFMPDAPQPQNMRAAQHSPVKTTGSRA